jgi:hypothetical protein
LQLGYGVRNRELPTQVKHVVEMLVDEGEDFRTRPQDPNAEKCSTCGRKPRPECR